MTNVDSDAAASGDTDDRVRLVDSNYHRTHMIRVVVVEAAAAQEVEDEAAAVVPQYPPPSWKKQAAEAEAVAARPKQTVAVFAAAA